MMETFFHLPEEIILDILSRLPVESVLVCKLVCKNWRSLVCESSFADMHLRRLYDNNAASGMVGLFFSASSSDGLNDRVYYGEYDKNDGEQSYMKVRRIDLHPPDQMGGIVGSCNGLICISIRHQLMVDDPVYIWNPITRECVNLPWFDFTPFEQKYIFKGHMMAGFGYHFDTNEYKVVRIFYPIREPSVGRVQVYTLGSSSGWRDKGEITYSIPLVDFSSPGILVNGALHWVDNKAQILAFDLADESFQLLPSPPCFDPHDFLYKKFNHFRLGVLGGWLSVYYDNYNGTADIWSLKEKNNHDMKPQHEHQQVLSWSRELRVKLEGSAFVDDDDDYCPTALMTKSGDVLFYDDTMFNRMGFSLLSRYAPRTSTIENFVDLDYDVNWSSFSVIPDHVNSFVSLRALWSREKKIEPQADELKASDSDVG